MWSGVLAMLALSATLMVPVGLSAKEPAKTGEPPADRLAPTDLLQVTFRQQGTERTVAGCPLVEAADGGVLLESADGRLWTIEPDEIQSREVLPGRFQPLTSESLGRVLQEEVGAECEILTTRHYVLCTRADRAYAQWCGALFERLYAAFQNYWKQRGVVLHEPEFPLPVLIFANEKQFGAFATRDAGPDVASAKGYYSITSNRIVLYDLSATDGALPAGGDIARKLAAAPYNIATVIHEATHQIAFNTGMHTRYADNPLWLTEGMAMYFETPDLTSRSGWKTVGAVNDLRLRHFQDYLTHRRPNDSLETLLKSDSRFTDNSTMGDAYAEAWALSYYLIRAKKEPYVKYLREVAASPRLKWGTPEDRLRAFQAAFGGDLPQIDTEFLRFIRRLK